ncbi:MAG: nucleotidyl transferase AbiEii/AbiGii toxin family protein [Pseudomonadota bacterium]
MKISPEKLAAEAEATGFRPDVLEKVAHLLGLLDAMRSHPFLKGKLVLKGGTALNLFVFDVPRLSVDIDLNYVGAEDREAMIAERPQVEQAVQAVFAREGFTVRRMPEEHAGGKWSLRYESAPGRSGNLEVDINFMFRLPLWPVTTRDSHSVGGWRATGIPVLDHHELAAGKLAALIARKQVRDLFDSHRILLLDSILVKASAQIENISLPLRKCGCVRTHPSTWGSSRSGLPWMNGRVVLNNLAISAFVIFL